MKNRDTQVSAVLSLNLTRGYVILLSSVSAAPAVLLSGPTAHPATLTPTRSARLPPRSHSSVHVVLPGPGNIAGGNERGVSLSLRPKAGVFEDVSALINVRLLRAEQLVGPGRRSLKMGANVERRSRAEEGGRRRHRSGSIFVGVVVRVSAVDVVLAGTRYGRERVWRESTILCIFIVIGGGLAFECGSRW